MAIDYKQAGVDIIAGDALVSWLQSTSKQKKDKRVLGGIGGFAALFKADFKKMKSPCLVSSTDGVGTKVLLASHFNQYAGVGQDLVAMCVNDLLCVGADPLFFLDYYACGKLDLKNAQEFLSGVRKACAEVECSLIGGETAEMPGVYKAEDFDCAGFAVGVVDEKKTLGAHKVKPGDVVIGVPSSGFHSNGFSLLRKVFEKDLDQWRDKLMVPTALYGKLVKNLRKNVKGLKACANITGGGLENIPRVLPKGTTIAIEPWFVPEPFKVVKERTGMSWDKMLVTLNCGLGFAIIVDPKDSVKAQKIVAKEMGSSCVLGIVEKQAGPAKLVSKLEPTYTVNVQEFESVNRGNA